MEDLSDRELWADAAAGSDASFGALFERHASAVYNYCFRRTADWAAAEDLMAATFLEAWRKRDQVRLTGNSLRPWLYGVATNLLRNQRRSNRRREAALARVRQEVAHRGLADDVASRIDDEREMRRLLKLISEMPVRNQDVIALVVWSELSYEEAATALGVRIGTVKSRLARARKKLAELADRSGHSHSDSNALARASETEPREVEG